MNMARTYALADCNTIVDMNLRVMRFILCVIAALTFAFGFALLTSNKKTLTYVYEDQVAVNETLSTKASSVVEDNNTLFGYILFAGGKIFEVFCETLIFPTLATYLHNCSLYLGDRPARMHSVAKARCIFWGLKTVIILMNVGFTSVYVGKTMLDPSVVSRRLTAHDELMQMKNLNAPNFDADLLRSILRTSVTGFTAPFEFIDTCQSVEQGNTNEKQPWEVWPDDVDTTSVSFSFPSHEWNAALFTSDIIVPKKTAEILLRDYLDNRNENATTCEWDPVELYLIFQQCMVKMGLVSVSVQAATPLSHKELIQVIVDHLRATLPAKAQLSDLRLNLQQREIAENVKFTTLTISIPFEPDDTGSMLCGVSGCVYATSTSVLDELHLQPRISIASNEKFVNSALVYSATSQFVLNRGQAPHEVLVLSLSEVTWKLSPLHIRHNAACADGDEHQCLGLVLPLATNNGVLLVGKEALSVQHAVHPVALVTLQPAIIPGTSRFDKNALTTWHRLISPDGKLMHPCLAECMPLVDAYLMHLESNHFYLNGEQTQDMFAAALFYLLQSGVLRSWADVMSRRHLMMSAVMGLNGSGSGDGKAAAATTDIEVNVPTATAFVTVAGCIFIVLLTMCVICLPTPRVRLSPDTTPAAQYVQILTDDLYPDLVHKKRLRFANGDCLLFNEYVVDAIVLHAKRDQTKKIYL
ncbi:unnamed protein product [Peronospora belbahrii]|uniref:Transmembrane protein n=1 Tax=Peronospora belbahrii TaxID=622444 RepID=A0AAU9KY28_9STRA|nr:unnamed protein product [Peronospora belbahrii]CAH0516073.1 unnamed protein product [Peronospora belbahrii]